MNDTERRPLDYATPPHQPKRRRWLIICAAVLAVLIVSYPTLLRTLNRARQPAGIRCDSNLRQIGQAMMLYANDHGGKYPDAVEGLLEEGIGTEAFICPSTIDTRATGATTQAIVAEWATPGCFSYIYLGKGFTDKCSTDTVLMYEPLSNHDGDGSNVLFGDGHVRFVQAITMKKIIAELTAGQNPPPLGKGF